MMLDQSHDKYEVGTFVVCYVDLLGQAAALRKWSEIPIGVQTEELKIALKCSAGKIIPFRKAFQDFFYGLNIEDYSHPVHWNLTTDQKNKLMRARDTKLSIQQFSDTFVFYAPLESGHGDVMTRALFQMLIACAAISIWGLAGKTPIRGAISIGWGVEIASNTFYGPALLEAYELEAQAGRPRILLSKQVGEFLGHKAGFSDDPTVEKLAKEWLQLSRHFLHTEDNGCLMIDSLSPALRHVVPRDLVILAYQFVAAEADRFSQLRDDKHATRYSELRDAMRCQLHHWNIIA